MGHSCARCCARVWEPGARVRGGAPVCASKRALRASEGVEVAYIGVGSCLASYRGLGREDLWVWVG